MSSDLLHVLKAAGLDERQSLLYLTGLQIGSVPASEYAKFAGVNRITAYNTLEELVAGGLFTVEKASGGKCYSPVSPEYLAVEARKNAEAVERALPELRSLRGAEFRKPHVRFFEGREGVRKIYHDTLNAKSDILNFANSSVVRSFWPEYDAEYVMERVKRGVFLRGIAPDDETGKRVHGEDRDMLREIRLVPSSQFDFKNEIKIYDHKVAISSFGSDSADEHNTFGVIIESKEVAETLRQIFEMAWRFAEQIE